MAQPDTDAYVAAMNEIKRRDLIASSYIRSERRTQFKASDIELAVLQVRLITELIALASLAAHKQLFEENKRKFCDHWHPGRIIRDLRSLNPDFYPKPVVEVPTPDSDVKSSIQPRQDNFLTSDELVEMHGRCGNLLHASNPYGKARPYREYEERVPIWLGRIRSLLNCHEIRLIGDTDRFYLVHMKEARDDQVHMYTFQRKEA